MTAVIYVDQTPLHIYRARYLHLNTAALVKSLCQRQGSGDTTIITTSFLSLSRADHVRKKTEIVKIISRIKEAPEIVLHQQVIFKTPGL